MSRLSYVILSVCDIFCQNGGISFFCLYLFLFLGFLWGVLLQRGNITVFPQIKKDMKKSS